MFGKVDFAFEKCSNMFGMFEYADNRDVWITFLQKTQNKFFLIKIFKSSTDLEQILC